MKTKQLVLWIAVTAALALCLCLLWGLGASIQKDGLSHPNTATWVQAIGSIGAIAVAVAIGANQVSKQRHLEALKDAQELVRNLMLASVAAERSSHAANYFVQELERWLVNQGAFSHQTFDLDGAITLLEAVVAKTITAEAAANIVTLHQSLGALRNLCVTVQGQTDQPEHSDTRAFLKLWLDTVSKAKLELHEHARSAHQLLLAMQ